MFRVIKVMVILVVLPLCLAVTVQPANAVPGEVQVIPEGFTEPTNGPDEMDDCAGPGGPVEGDPDEVGGGYGATAGDSAVDDFLGGLLGVEEGGISLEEFIYLMMMQFTVAP